MTDGKIWKDEVSCRTGTVEVSHTGDRRACEDRKGWRGHWHPTFGDRASILQGGEEEKVGLVGEGDVCFGVALSLEDFELDDRRWIDWATVRRSCSNVSIVQHIFILTVTHIWHPIRKPEPVQAAG